MGAWRCAGPLWRETGPALGWFSPAGGERDRPLALGGPLAFTTVGDDRRCVGVWRAGRRTYCPRNAVIPVERTSAQCPDCTALDRSSSVAADTALDDPRAFGLYLAWFGPGLLKLGITAVVRGQARLLEQGALAHTWLGEGSLPAVRRAESALGTALGIPDRIPGRAKRQARAVRRQPGSAVRELTSAHDASTASTAWPDTLRPRPLAVVDHCGTYGLDPGQPIRADAEVAGLGPGCAVVGTLTAVVGPNAYLVGAQGTLTLNLRLAAGWALAAAAPGSRTTAATRALPRDEPTQAGLF